MNVLYVIENYLPHIGGVEVVFSQLAEGLVKQGHKVTILTHKIKGTKNLEMINGVKVIRVPCFGSRYLFSFLAIPKAIKLGRDADVIHTTTFNGTLPAWKAARISGKPLVITVHEAWLGYWDELTDMSWLSRKIHAFFEWMIYRLPYDKYVAVSDHTAKDLHRIGIPDKKIVRIYNAVDYNLFDPKKYSRRRSRKKLNLPSGFLYFAYGRPGVSKGFEYLIKAVPEIYKKIPNAKLVVMLSKDKAYKKNYNEIKDLCSELKINDKIIFIDPVERGKLPLYISAMDCAVVPSLREGFGYAAVEPCAMDIPVVSTNAASLPEVVSGKHLFVPPKDSKAIAKAVIDVYKGKYRVSKKKKFLLLENIKSYLSVYHELLSQAHERKRRE